MANPELLDQIKIPVKDYYSAVVAGSLALKGGTFEPANPPEINEASVPNPGSASYAGAYVTNTQPPERIPATMQARWDLPTVELKNGKALTLDIPLVNLVRALTGKTKMNVRVYKGDVSTKTTELLRW